MSMVNFHINTVMNMEMYAEKLRKKRAGYSIEMALSLAPSALERR